MREKGNFIPPQFVGGKSNLYTQFIEIGRNEGDSESDSIELLKLLPIDLKRTNVWLDKITNIWRYDYGLPLDNLPEDMIVFGTGVSLPVLELYHSIKLADKHLTRLQLMVFIKRLEDKGKHTDVLFEMRPLLYLSKGFSPKFEVPGFGDKNTTLDWFIKGKGIKLAFDVKNRTRSLIKGLESIIPRMNKGEQHLDSPPPDPKYLFRSVENKLERVSSFRRIQGVWIQTEVKEKEDDFISFFRKKLDKKKTHFVILSDWKEDGYILTRNRIIKLVIKKVFNIIESKRFVADDY